MKGDLVELRRVKFDGEVGGWSMSVCLPPPAPKPLVAEVLREASLALKNSSLSSCFFLSDP